MRKIPSSRSRDRWPRVLVLTALLGLAALHQPRQASAACGDDPLPPEICNGIDDDCDGFTDEGFDVGAFCGVGNPAGCSAGDPGGCCLTPGAKVCTGDGLGTVCQTSDPLLLQEPEGQGADPDPSCFDGDDDDCDGLVDHQDPDCQTAEFCNGFDDDNNGQVDDTFVGLNGPCSVGVGECAKTGTRICNATKDGTVCSATASNPKPEGPPTDNSCTDGKDNDCDGQSDLTDSDCQGPEICDGADNDGDGSVDEDFPTLGNACSTGVGACAATGVLVCSFDKTGTRCDATPPLAGVEGPAGPTCSDGQDNDCDGFTDLGDSNCNSALLAATCSLDLEPGQANDCRSLHRIHFNVSGAGLGAEITAELLALDAEGNTIESVSVQDNDLALLWSTDRKVKVQSSNHFHRVTAPLPMLRVHVKDGQNEADAFCSPIPVVKSLEPGCCGFSSTSDNAVQPVTVAIPGIDPKSITVRVDGVDILAAIGVDPATDFPGGPYSGNVVIGGANVHVAELFVRIDANTLTFDLENLPCGGHLIDVKGVALADAVPTGGQNCHEDDLRDKCVAAVLGVTIDSPQPLEVTTQVPTPVSGSVCHGRPIASLSVQGNALSTAAQTLTPGDGKMSADTYRLNFQTTLGQTNLKQDVDTANGTITTLDAGSNRLIADAKDEFGNRAFATVVFATGQVAPPGVGPLAAFRGGPRSALAMDPAEFAKLPPEVRKQLEDAMLMSMTEIQNAFAVGLTPEAVQTVFTEKCASAGTDFFNAVRNKVLAAAPQTTHVSIDCSCDLDVRSRITDVQLIDPSATTTCPVTFQDGRMLVSVNLPAIRFAFDVEDSCRDTFLGVCIAKSWIDYEGSIDISGMHLDFQVTEEQLEKATPPPCGNGVVDTFEFCDPSAGSNGCDAGESCAATCTSCFNKGTTTEPAFTKEDAGVGCIGAVLCQVFDFLINVFTFGLVDIADVTIDVPDVPTADVGAEEADPIELGDIKVDEETVEAFEVALKGELDQVEITQNGLVASLKGVFNTLSVDPEVPATPGAVLTPAPAPTLPTPGANDAYFVLADDTFNQLFASLVASGKLKTAFEATTAKTCSVTTATRCSVDGDCPGGETCVSTPLTIKSFVPNIDDPAAPGKIKLLKLLLATKQIFPTTRILVHGRTEMPPRLLITDDAATGPVETQLRMNDLSIELIVDRDSDGADGAIGTAPKCFQAGSPLTGDCFVLQMCLDLNFPTAMQFETCTDPITNETKPGIVSTVGEVQIPTRQVGLVCGAAAETPDQAVTDAGLDTSTIGVLEENATDAAPPLCTNGLNLGGLGMFANPKLFAIETDGNPEFQDFLGVTGDIVP